MLSRAVRAESAKNDQAARLAGLGLIQAPRIGAKALLAQELLVEVLPDLRAEPMPVSLVYPNRRHLSKRVQALLAWLAEVLTPHLDPVD